MTRPALLFVALSPLLLCLPVKAQSEPDGAAPTPAEGVAAAPAEHDGASPAQRALVEARSLLVLDIELTGELPLTVETITARIAEVIAEHAELRVYTMADIEDASLLAKSKATLGCESDQECLAQITKALEAELVLSGTLGQIGTSIVLSLSLVDPDSASSIARSSDTFTDADELVERLPDAIGRLLGWTGDAQGVSYQLPEGERVSFAVFDLEAAGVSEEVALNLTQVLSVEIKRIENTTVISRDDIMAMLQLEKERSILTCIDDTACIAEIGGALGVDKLVVGHVGKLASSYVVSLRLIDARSVEVNGRVSESFDGIEDQLIRAVRQAARDLLGIDSDESGILALTGTQPQAIVSLDNELLGALPMHPVEKLAPGRHTVRVTKEGFVDWRTDFYIDPGGVTPIFADLTAEPPEWYEHWWVWAGAGAVVLGTAGLYYWRATRLPDSDLGSYPR